MNKIITTLMLVGVLSPCSLPALAAESTTQGSAVPPSAVPGINQSHGSESNEEKANKKGEEASGSNSGADSQTLEKESSTSNSSQGYEKKQGSSGSGS